jgi:TolB-like protein
MTLFNELKRRNVFRVGAAYLVLSWLLLQVGALLLPLFGAPEWVVRVLVLLLAAGFVAVLLFSWIYELTPEGLKRDHEVDRNASITSTTGRKLDVAVILLLVPAIGLAGYTQLRARSDAVEANGAAATHDARPSLAVLPFVNMSAVAENEYFSDGLTETLLNMLSQVDGLKVTARTSAFAFKGTNKDIREIATTLNVNAVLEGSVQRAGQRVRITAQLIDARDGSHLWSKSYDRTLDDLFDIQDEIAKAVAAELARSLLGKGAGAIPRAGPAPTHNGEAYDTYLHGLERMNVATYAALPDAERQFKQAIAADPEFVDARLALGRTYLLMADTGLLGLREAADRARPALAPLLAGDHPNPRAVACDAILHWGFSDSASGLSEREQIRSTVLRSLALAPNAVELYSMVSQLSSKEQAAEALGIVDRGLEIDPLSAELLNDRARQLARLGRIQDALGVYAQLREIAPDAVWGYAGAAMLYMNYGPYVDAAYWYARAMQVDRDDHELPANVAQQLLTLGLIDEARPWIERAELLNGSGSDTRRVEIQYAERTGDLARALQLSEDIVRARRDNRRGIYVTAAIYYMTLMDEAGRTDEALALMEAVSPGISALPPAEPASEFDLAIQAIATPYLLRTSDAAARATRVKHLEDSFYRMIPDANYDGDYAGAVFAAMEGDNAGAKEILLRVLADPGELPWEWRVSILRDPLLGGVAKDPEVAAVIAKMEADFAAQGERYRKLVADGEITVP